MMINSYYDDGEVMMLYSFMDKVMKAYKYWNSLIVKPCLLTLEVF
jgi:hypothetical protein